MNELDLDMYSNKIAQRPGVLKGYLGNLLCGVRIIFFRSSGIKQLQVTMDQLLLLLITTLVVLLLMAIQTSPDEWSLGDELGSFALGVLASMLAGYLLVKFTGDGAGMLHLLVASYALTPPLLGLMLLIPWEAVEGQLALIVGLGAVILLWSLVLTVFVPYVLLQRRFMPAMLVAVVWLIATLPSLGAGLSSEDFSLGEEGMAALLAQDEDEYTLQFDAEKVLYDQFYRLDQVLQPLQPQQPGVSDLYFVGFGSYSYQDVFMREVNHIQHSVDSYLGTYGRSLLLINNEETVEQQPIASATNLQLALNYLGEQMDVEEDVLMLYLTSHGSSEHQLSVEMWPLPLNDITPQDLRQQLDDSGIRWRIIMVSACYSGGFIEPLQDERTLIVTASAADKSSFGCSDANEYTYFGEALFKDMPEGEYQFLTHINEALAAIAAREVDEELEPSLPQLYVGEKMQQKLMELESAIATYSTIRFAPVEGVMNEVDMLKASDG